MKNLPCLVLLAPLAGLGFLALASTFGFEFPFAFVAAHLIGFTGAAGALVIFLKDYTPRRGRSIALDPVPSPAEPAKEPALPIVTCTQASVRATPRRNRPVVRTALSASRFTRDPATLTLS